jgi:hypothetical protein
MLLVFSALYKFPGEKPLPPAAPTPENPVEGPAA